MQKVILKVYIEKKLKPLFVAEIYDTVDETLENFQKQLNDNSKYIITFGRIAFKKSLFHHYEIIYK